jgi:hypothetical protein
MWSHLCACVSQSDMSFFLFCCVKDMLHIRRLNQWHFIIMQLDLCHMSATLKLSNHFILLASTL